MIDSIWIHGCYCPADQEPVYYDTAHDRHANVFMVEQVDKGMVDLCGPVCEPSQGRTKLLAMFIPIGEFVTSWRLVWPIR